MEPNERFEDFEEAVRTALDGRQAQIWTALPAKITKVNHTANTVEARPTTQARIKQPDGTFKTVTMPVCLDVPLHYPSGGGFSMTFPVKEGDECLLTFASRSIDNWWKNGGNQPPNDLRMHDLSDGFAFVGFRSQPQRIDPAPSADTVQLRSDDGKTYIELAAEGLVNVACKTLTITAETRVHIDTPQLEVTGDVIAQSGADGSSDQRVRLVHHTHRNVQPGGGHSGEPDPGS